MFPYTVVSVSDLPARGFVSGEIVCGAGAQVFSGLNTSRAGYLPTLHMPLDDKQKNIIKKRSKYVNRYHPHAMRTGVFFVIIAGLLQAGISRGRDLERGFQPGLLFFFVRANPYSFILRHRVL